MLQSCVCVYVCVSPQEVHFQLLNIKKWCNYISIANQLILTQNCFISCSMKTVIIPLQMSSLYGYDLTQMFSGQPLKKTNLFYCRVDCVYAASGTGKLMLDYLQYISTYDHVRAHQTSTFKDRIQRKKKSTYAAFEATVYFPRGPSTTPSVLISGYVATAAP